MQALQTNANSCLLTIPDLVSGQFDSYTHRQLMNWKNGVRGTHPKDMYGMQMIGMAATLVDETAVKNISAYIANLGK